MNYIKSAKKNIIFLQLSSFTDVKYSYFNIGMLSIATLLKNNEYSVDCLKIDDLAYIDKEQYFVDSAPEIIGLNINSDNISLVKYFAGYIKKILPQTVILVGGPLVSILKDSVLDKPEIDFAIIGEGEFPTLQLCNKVIKKEGSYENIEGLIYRDKNNKVILNPKPEPIENLDILPCPDYSLVGTVNSFFYSSGRGCPFSCSFCFQGVHGKGYRYFSSKRVINDLIETSKKYQTQSIGIIDDTFIANPKRTIEICEGLVNEKLKHNLKFKLWCEGRIDTLYRHPELLPILKKAGLVKIQLGIENGNQEILDIYNKKITLEQIEAVVENIAREKNICANSNIIIGGAFETVKTFEKSLNFSLKLMNLAKGIFELSPAFLCPYPGTDVANNPSKYGIKLMDTDWLKSLSVQLPSCATKSLNAKKLMNLKYTFLETVDSEMLKILKELDFETIEFQMNLAEIHFETDYYNKILNFAPIIRQYFNLKNDSSRFRLENAPQNRYYIKPLCLIKPLCQKGTYVLKGYFKEIYITSDEKKIYDLSNGKLTMLQIAKFIKPDTDNEIEIHSFIDKIMIPFFKRLEKSYHILFQF